MFVVGFSVGCSVSACLSALYLSEGFCHLLNNQQRNTQTCMNVRVITHYCNIGIRQGGLSCKNISDLARAILSATSNLGQDFRIEIGKLQRDLFDFYFMNDNLANLSWGCRSTTIGILLKSQCCISVYNLFIWSLPEWTCRGFKNKATRLLDANNGLLSLINIDIRQ